MEILDDGKVIVLDSRSVLTSSDYTCHAPLPCTASPLHPYQIRRDDSIIDQDVAVGKKKRKRSKYEPNQPELDFNARHDAIEPHLSLALEKVHSWMEANKSNSIPQALGLDTQPRNDKTSSEPTNSPPPPLPPLDFIALAALRNVTKPKFSWISDHLEVLEEEDSTNQSLNLFDTLITNESNTEKTATVFDDQYAFVIPPQSSFLLSDMKSKLRPLLKNYQNNQFQCIVIDPPWENRSVKRSSATSSSYQTLPNLAMLSLPVGELAAPGCLVALWVTNREKLRKFIENELLIKWKVKHVATWHWLKVVQDGRPVTPLDAAHRRPYESLLLCYKVDEDLPPTRTQPKEHVSIIQPRDNVVIVSVPTEHSRKPFIGNLLQRHVEVFNESNGSNPPARCLEMFAREMHRGWVSWGNEVLKFQAIEHFAATDNDAGKQQGGRSGKGE